VCGTLARFFQVQKGNRRGYLYRRCECGANQTTGAAQQVKWLNTMDRTAEPMIPHPLEQVQTPEPDPEKPQQEPEPETPEPPANTEGNRKPETNKAGLFGLIAMGAAVAVAMMT